MKFSLERWLKNRKRRKDVSTETAEADAEAAAMTVVVTVATAAAQARLHRQLRPNRQPQRLLLLPKEVMSNYVNAESSKVQKTSSYQL